MRGIGMIVGMAFSVYVWPFSGLARGKMPPLFENVARESGMDFVNVSGEIDKPNITGSLGSGAALFDYDQDGDLDAFLVNGARTAGVEVRERLPNRLFRNMGGWRFLDVTAEAGVGDLGWGMGCAVGDYDNDGLPDLYLTNLGANALYRNLGDGTFRDVTDSAGVGDPSWGTSAAWIDADRDSDLDLFVVNYLDPSIRKVPSRSSSMVHAPGVLGDIYCRFQDVPVFCGPAGLVGAADVFYRNEGDGRFSLATHAFGIDDSAGAYGLGVVTLDYDGDGSIDVYVVNDAMPNQLYRNRNGQGFEEVGLTAGVAYNASGRAEAGMGVDAADVNRDGLLDLFVTNFSHETNTLYVNQGGGVFIDRTEELFPGRPSFSYLGWAVRFLDFDLDGDEDLFVSNGHVFPQIEGREVGTSYRQPNQIFENDRGRFSELALPGNDASRELESSRGVAFGDLDDDGMVDAVVVNIDSSASLLKNTGSLRGNRHWIGFRLIGRSVNRDGYGARVTLALGDFVLVREVHASGYLSSSDLRVHFGIGNHDLVESARVKWPDGSEQRLEPLAADRYHTIVQEAAFATVSRSVTGDSSGGGP
ncbi:MAG TPA: CRTAC1 family protein [Vicinamibacteria bacterium]|nr:CRTAC1 family protein [Vicinamibacteria bacterium]